MFIRKNTAFGVLSVRATRENTAFGVLSVKAIRGNTVLVKIKIDLTPKKSNILY